MRGDRENVHEWIGISLKRGEVNGEEAPPSPPPRRIWKGDEPGESEKRGDRLGRREGCFRNFVVLNYC